VTPAKLEVKQVASTIGRPHPQRRVIAGLGLRGPGSSVTVDNTPSFRGMIKKVLHLVSVSPVGAPEARKEVKS
jgi:large subunit ribosomal protein L30